MASLRLTEDSDCVAILEYVHAYAQRSLPEMRCDAHGAELEIVVAVEKGDVPEAALRDIVLTGCCKTFLDEQKAIICDSPHTQRIATNDGLVVCAFARFFADSRASAPDWHCCPRHGSGVSIEADAESPEALARGDGTVMLTGCCKPHIIDRLNLVVLEFAAAGASSISGTEGVQERTAIDASTIETIDIKLHSNAAAQFNARVQELVCQLSLLPPEPPGSAPSSPSAFDGLHTGTLEGSHIRPGLLGVQDAAGSTVAEYVPTESGYRGLAGDAYAELLKIAEALHARKEFLRRVSVRFIVEFALPWLIAREADLTSHTFSDDLLDECRKKVEKREVWIPAHGLIIPGPFKVGRVVFRQVPASLLDRFDRPDSRLSLKGRVQFEVGMESRRSRLQGYGAAVVSVCAEPIRAVEVGLEEADKAMGVLRYFSRVNLVPELVSVCAPHAAFEPRGIVHFLVSAGGSIALSESEASNSEGLWCPTKKDVEDMFRRGLGVLGDLLASESRNDFEEAVLTALLHYTRNALASEASDKLLHILVALESFFIRSNSEPIQKNLGERIAWLIDKDLEGRKRTVKIVGTAYGFRSSFLHHGRNISTTDLEAMREFMLSAWSVFFELIRLVKKKVFNRREDLLDELDNRKLGGEPTF